MKRSASNLVTSARIALCISTRLSCSVGILQVAALSGGNFEASTGANTWTSVTSTDCVYSPMSPVLLLRAERVGDIFVYVESFGSSVRLFTFTCGVVRLVVRQM